MSGNPSQMLRALAASGMLFVSAHAFGLNLPAVELGDSCEHAAEVEVAANAHPVSPVPHMLSQGLLGFDEVSTADLPEQIIYHCDENGRVDRYSIDFRIRNPQRAKALYAEIKADLRSRSGPPDTDSDRFDARHKKLLAGLFTSDTAVWKDFYGKEVSVYLDLPDSLGESRVSVGARPRKR